MKKKKCFKCDEVLPLSEFYKHPQMADGHLNKCKKCNRRDVRENRKDNIEYYREYDRVRNKTDARKKSCREKNNRRHEKYPYKKQAVNMVNSAIRRGDIVRPDKCERCDATERIQGHHDDHKKPFEIMWLCPVCHAQRHKELGLLNQIDE